MKVENKWLQIPILQIFDLRQENSKQIQSKKSRKYIKETQDLINKFRAKNKAVAQTLIRKLEKLEIIEEKEILQSKLSILHLIQESKSIIKKYWKKIWWINSFRKCIRNLKVKNTVENGEGKSTLAKIIVNEIDFSGCLVLGHQIKVGYYAQNQAEFLDDSKTVLETIYDAADESTSPKVRNILGSFLFSDDTVDKKIKVLSGGERARVALCKLLLQPVNLLVMDEPTNHLDIKSKELLKQALVEYDGSLIIVSHDREFLQGLTKKVYEFKDRNIKEYLGDINHFLKEKKIENFNQLEASQLKQKIKKVNSANKISYQEKKEKDKKIKKISKR